MSMAMLAESSPCNHSWDGPRIVLSEGASIATCSKCGEPAIPLDDLQRGETPVRRETEEPADKNDNCPSCGEVLAYFAGPALGEKGRICQTPGCDMEDIELI